MNHPRPGPDDVHRLIVHRETHSSRAVPALILAGLTATAALYVLLEALLQALGQPAWLVAPADVGAWFAALPELSPSLLAAAGLFLAVVGLLLLGQALLPGRRARHGLPSSRAAVVVDAEVIAASLARRARLAAGVNPEQVLVTVARKLVDVQVRPTSGIPVDSDAVRAAVDDELGSCALDPQPEVRVRIASRGVVGQ